jgi:5-hydroxydodecatetraenal polyketide synthase CpkC
MSPVDYVAAAIVELSRQPDACTRAAYHVVNPQYYFWQRLFALMRGWGYTLEPVPYREWRRRLARSADNALKPLIALFPVPPDEGDDGSVQRWAAAPPVHCDRAQAALAGTGVTCPPLVDALWARYFEFFVRAGYLTRPEGACSFSVSPAVST